jgi:hypothetical protein
MRKQKDKARWSICQKAIALWEIGMSWLRACLKINPFAACGSLEVEGRSIPQETRP